MTDHKGSRALLVHLFLLILRLGNRTRSHREVIASQNAKVTRLPCIMHHAGHLVEISQTGWTKVR
jgi:hypothetical protein